MYDLSEWEGRITEMGEGIFELARSAYAVNLLAFFMIQIKGAVIVISEIRDNTAGDSNAHSCYIDADEHTVFQDAAKGNKEIVSYHADVIANKRATCQQAIPIKLVRI